jgi:hypothetical protein
LHHRNEGPHPGQAKPQWRASCKLRQSDVIGFDRDRGRHRGQKRGHIWSHRNHFARLVCTYMMVRHQVVHQRVTGVLTSKKHGASIYPFACARYLCQAIHARAWHEALRYLQLYSKQTETHGSSMAEYSAWAPRQKLER